MLVRVFADGMDDLGGRDEREVRPHEPLTPRRRDADVFGWRLAPVSSLFASNLHVAESLDAFEQKSKPCT
jgi:hypothetical protein